MSPDVIFGSIGVVLFAAIVFEVWKYVRDHPKALASVQQDLATLKGKMEATVATDTAAIHAKLDALTMKVDATHAAALAPVTVTVVPATPSESVTDKLFPQGKVSTAPAAPAPDDTYRIRRNTTILTSFGMNAFPAGKGAIQIKAPSYPCVVRTNNQPGQEPGMTAPESIFLWFSTDPSTARPAGTMGWLNGNGYLQVPSDGYVCYESDTGGVFNMILSNA